MSILDSSKTPYYNDYNPSKGYIQILAVPGRVEQAREFTQIQSMFLDFLKRIGSLILKNGSVVEGCSLSISNTTATVSSGKIYFDGIVYDMPESTLTITGTGIETIGVQVNQVVVTEVEDATLKDPAEGYDNYGQVGAHRVASSLQYVVSDPTSAIVYKLNEGIMVNLEEKPQLDMVGDLLAKRTYDESGDYKVSGLGLSTEVRNGNPYLSIESGRAYIQGYSVTKPSTFRVALDKSVDTRMVLNEPKVYHAATQTYSLNNPQIADVSRLSATVQVTQDITRGNIAGGLDKLPKTPVVAITTITQGATIYNSGVDFQLTNDSVDWSLSGAEPSGGSSYSATYQYVKQMAKDTDYKITTVDSTSYVDFTPAGDNPVEGTTFYADYSYYLARKDLVLMDQEGSIEILKGQSDLPEVAEVRSVAGLSKFVLGYVYLPPNSVDAVAYSTATNRVSMMDIQKLASRLDTLEYNQAVNDLDTEAQSGQSPTQLKGILTDGFIGFTKADTNRAGFDVAFDLINKGLVMPTTQDIYPLSVSGSSTSRINPNGVLATNLYTNALALSQPKATKGFLVNPYAVYNRMSLLSASPAVDYWVDTSKVVIQGTAINNLGTISAGSLSYYRSIGALNNYTVVTDKVLETAIDYMRQNTIAISGSNLTPGADNLVCTFDGLPVLLSPTGSTEAGTSVGSVKADSKGNFSATFTIPSNVKTGSKTIKVYNDNNSMETVYTATGIKRVTEEHVTQVRTTYSVWYNYDPLSQSFQVEEDCFLSSVGLYFTAKDGAGINVVVQLRNMENGFPGSIIYAEKVVQPSEITASPNASVETLVNFDDVIQATAGSQYCVCLLSDSSAYAVGVAELDGTDLVTKAKVSQQPYVAGTMFSSANALTWTAHQTMDLKFNLYKARFSSSSSILFNSIGEVGKNYDHLVAMIGTLCPNGTSIDWEMSLNGRGFVPMAVGQVMNFNTATDTIQVKGTLHGTENLTPMLNAKSAGLTAYKSKLAAVYYTKLVELPAAYTDVTVSLDIAAPSGTSAVVQFSADDGATWITPTKASEEQVDSDFVRYTFTNTLGTGSKKYRGKISMSASNGVTKPRVKRYMNVLK